MPIPIVKFEISPITLEADLLRDFSDPKERFSAIMRAVYPELGEIMTRARNENEVKEACKRFAETVLKKNELAILKARDEIEKDWNPMCEQFLRVLSEHMETDWPIEKPAITGYVSTLPICPRFLDSYSFTIDFRKPTSEARVTVAHEILHFLWF